VPRPRLHEVEERAELREPLGERTRELEVEELRDALAQLVEVAQAEGGAHPVLRAERVHEHGHVEVLDALEQQGHVLLGRAFRHAVGNLGNLEVARDGDRDPA
jgi:hypothetical protein